MLTPQQFVETYNGGGWDIDNTAGMQCVDGFKIFTEVQYGFHNYNTTDGYAEGLWTYRKSKPYYQYFDDTPSVNNLQNGDWVIWGFGGVHPDSHVAMYYNGQFFGMNQLGVRTFTLVNDTTANVLGVLRPKIYSNLTWISKDTYLNQSEMENNATIIINYYRSIGIEDRTIAGILGNMQAESTLSPILNERGGGGGYGLVQWTPKSDLINACSTLGLSPYTSGDVQIQVVKEEISGPSSVRQWYTTSAFISNYYNSGATSDMIGITGDEFLNNTMNWTPEKLAIMFMAGYERPSYLPLINHYLQRQQNARNWFNFMSGLTPPTPIYSKKKKGYNFVLFNRRRRLIKNG